MKGVKGAKSVKSENHPAALWVIARLKIGYRAYRPYRAYKGFAHCAVFTAAGSLYDL